MVLKTPPLKIPKLRLGVKVVCDANIELMAPTVAAPITTDTAIKHQFCISKTVLILLQFQNQSIFEPYFN